MKLSVIIVTRRRVALLNRCLISLSQAWVPEETEIVVIVNGREPQTEAFLSSVRLPRLRKVAINEVSRSEARNIGIQFSSGQVIHFLDDDVVVPEMLFKEALREFERNEDVSVVGGPNLTPPESPLLEKMFGAVMACPFVAPWANCRYRQGEREMGKRAVHRVILCNLAIRRAHLPGFVRFRTMTSNEENLLVHECLSAGGKVVYAPAAYVYHHRRPTLRSFFAQVVSYGRGRAEQTLTLVSSSHVIFAVPVLAILSLSLAILIGEYGGALVSVGVYGVMLSVSVAITPEIRALGLRALWGCFWLGPLVHLGYGWGVLAGVLDGGFRQVISLRVRPPKVKSAQRLKAVER